MNTTTDTSVEAGCLQAFLATGDVGHLLPLADHFAEVGLEAASATVRRVTDGEVSAEAVRFFMKHCGRDTLSTSAGMWLQFTCDGIKYADAEAWFEELEEDGRATVTWERDEESERENEADGEIYGCVVAIWTDATQTMTGATESLWNIELDTSRPFQRDPYARVVEAELKDELRRRLMSSN